MDMEKLSQEIAHASLYELYRLRVVIDQMLESPVRIEDVKSRLRPGMSIRYFLYRENRTVDAHVVNVGRTRLVVQNTEDGKQWKIAYGAVDVEGLEKVVRPEARQFEKAFWKVGDQVVFEDRQKRPQFGRITKLNPKTAAVELDCGETWTVHYEFLSPLIEGECKPLDWAKLSLDPVQKAIEDLAKNQQ